MNVGEWVGAGSGLVAIVGGGAALHPKLQRARDRARKRREDLDGVPPRIENGKTVDPGKPSLASAVRGLTETVARIDSRTEQLTRNGGQSVADAVHRIDTRIAELSANLDTWVNVAANDFAGIWEALSEAGLDRRSKPRETE